MENSIIDLIIRIKNGYMSKRELVKSPYSKYKEELLKILEKIGYIDSYQIEEKNKIKQVLIKLSYPNGNPAITAVKILSRPGKREYIGYRQLKPVMGGLGRVIISSSAGIIDNFEAKKRRLGGELLFEIW